MNTQEHPSHSTPVSEAAIREQEQFIYALVGAKRAILRGAELAQLLGYSGVHALRKHHVRGSAPVPLYKEEGVICAHTSQVARYLAQVKQGSTNV